MSASPQFSQSLWIPLLVSFASMLVIQPFSTSQKEDVHIAVNPCDSLVFYREEMAFYREESRKCQKKHQELVLEISEKDKLIARLSSGQANPGSSGPITPSNNNTSSPAAGYRGLSSNILKTKLNDFLNNPRTTHWGSTLAAFQNSFDIFVVDLRDPTIKVQFLWDDGPQGQRIGSLANAKKYVEIVGSSKLLMATNGGMYNKQHKPQGLLIKNRSTVIPLDLASQGIGNFYMQPNGVFYIDDRKTGHVVETQIFQDNQAAFNPVWATQSGPMLVSAGQINSKFNEDSNNEFIRSGVGVIDEYHIAFAISKYPVNFYHFAEVFRDILGCNNALFLDGVVSRMHCPGISRFDNDGNFGTIITIHQEK